MEPVFRLASETPFVCGHFVTKKLTSPLILSKKDGIMVLDAAEKAGQISSEETTALLESLNSSGIGEERPTDETIKIYIKNANKTRGVLVDLVQQLRRLGYHVQMQV